MVILLFNRVKVIKSVKNTGINSKKLNMILQSLEKSTELKIFLTSSLKMHMW